MAGLEQIEVHSRVRHASVIVLYAARSEVLIATLELSRPLGQCKTRIHDLVDCPAAQEVTQPRPV
jgi:hypothetical protein